MNKIGQAKREVIGNLSAVESHNMQTVHLHKINLCPAGSFYTVSLLFINLFAGLSLLQ